MVREKKRAEWEQGRKSLKTSSPDKRRRRIKNQRYLTTEHEQRHRGDRVGKEEKIT